MIGPNQIGGLLLAVLGAATVSGASRLPEVPGQPVGPAVFPTLIGIGLCLCGLLLAIGIGRRAELAAEGGVSAEDGEEAPLSPALLARIATPPALLVAYFFVVDEVGFLLTGFAVVLIAALTLGARPRLALPLAILVPVALNLVFGKLLRVPLPGGLLPLPW